MQTEYLIFNMMVLGGPLALSFDKKVNFVQYWPFALPAILITLPPYILWDALVTHRHWWFNASYTLDYRLFELPIGEWLFFVTVPYACLFIWEVIGAYFPHTTRTYRFEPGVAGVLMLIIGGALFYIGNEYTGLALLAMGLSIMIDRVLKTHVFVQVRLYGFLGIVGVLTLIFNGYLTARPVVLYDPQYQLDFRIFTIPVEDFAYGFSLVMFSVVLMEHFKQRAGKTLLQAGQSHARPEMMES